MQNGGDNDWREWRLHVLKTLEMLSESLKEMKEQQWSQGDILTRNTQSLEEHIKRTNLLEEKMEQVQAADNRLQGAIKLILILGTIAGIVAAIINITST